MPVYVLFFDFIIPHPALHTFLCAFVCYCTMIVMALLLYGEEPFITIIVLSYCPSCPQAVNFVMRFFFLFPFCLCLYFHQGFWHRWIFKSACFIVSRKEFLFLAIMGYVYYLLSGYHGMSCLIWFFLTCVDTAPFPIFQM